MQLLVAFLLTAAAFTSASIVKPSGENFELLILHNNDMHARFEQTSQLSGACTTADREAGKCYGGFPRVAHVVKEARRAAQTGEGPPVLYLNAGDTYTGTAWFTIYKWKIAAEFINALQPDAVSLGNHEFDTGVHGLAPFIQNVTCPVLSANLILTKVPELEQLTNLKKSIVIEVAERRIGIVGYLTPDTKRLAVPNDVEYTDEILAIRKEVEKLQNEGIDIIIALGHSGYPKDLEIAREVEGVDLVIGGHTNTFLWNGTSPDSEHSQGPYPTYLVQESGKSVAVVQAYAYTKYLGKLHLTFNSNGDLINADGTPILLDNKIPQDSDVLAIIKKYRNSLYNITEEVVGYTSVLLDGASCSRKECNLGNLITDAMIFRYAIDYTGEHWTDAPIAIIQAGGIRASISHVKMPANITQGELLTVMPFEGPLVTVTVNGSTLIKMIQHSVNNYNDLEASGPFLQYSGIKVVYDINKPKGSRLIKAEARCWACDVPSYSKIIDKDVYKVIMPGFVAIGGDGYKMFSGLPTKTLGYSELVATQYYVKRHSPIYTQIEGRITLLTDNFQPNTNSSSYIVRLSLISVLLAFLLSLL